MQIFHSCNFDGKITDKIEFANFRKNCVTFTSPQFQPLSFTNLFFFFFVMKQKLKETKRTHTKTQDHFMIFCDFLSEVLTL